MTMTTIAGHIEHGSFTSSGEIYITLDLAKIESNDSKPALDSAGFTEIQLINYGYLANYGFGPGLRFTEFSTGSVVNQLKGMIYGYNGVELLGTGVSFTNEGKVFATKAAIYLGPSSQNNVIENDGYIQSDWEGIHDSSNHGGNTIINHFGINGKHGIGFDTQPGLVTTVINDGTITGKTAAIITSTAGTLHLTNTGIINGDVYLHSLSSVDNDIIINGGSIYGWVQLGNGNDQFAGPGSVNDGVFGEAGNDILSGGTLDDRLDGGAGNDRLAGGGDNDTLTGGTEADHFVFNVTLATAGVDLIIDFQHGIDKIDLKHSIFSAANAAGMLKAGMFFQGAAAHDADDRIIYNPNNGWLTYDSNGKAAGGAHHFATLDAHMTLTSADFLIV